ncbi:calcium/sodium antiporter [Patescibacteria group bacterium]|jgi:cation:H+ antiporter|nr:calcium/sodium antiporter [Patescibacteria group bacterium]
MYLNLFLFILGFVFLIKGANWLVDGASSIAKKFRVSDLVIGLTIVSFGTSAPELIVNLMASIQGSGDLAITNILGSNIVNILFILGVSAIIFPLAVKKNTTWKEIPLALLAVVILWILCNDVLFAGQSLNILSRGDGFVLIAFFIIFLYYTFGISKVEGEPETVKKYSNAQASLMIVAGIVGLTLGGRWIVDGAIFMAQFFGLSESLIGLTIVAIGTSLPEFATSAVAAWKHNADIAVGNIVGSNIFNIFWILGISAVIRPIVFNSNLNFDVYVVITATFLLFIWMFIGKKHILQRWQGFAMLALYIFYIVYLIIRG